MSRICRGVSADEKQIERNRRRCLRATSRSVSVTALDQISLSPAMDELPSRQTIIGPLPFSEPPPKFQFLARRRLLPRADGVAPGLRLFGGVFELLGHFYRFGLEAVHRLGFVLLQG